MYAFLNFDNFNVSSIRSDNLIRVKFTEFSDVILAQ